VEGNWTLEEGEDIEEIERGIENVRGPLTHNSRAHISPPE